MHAIFQKKGKKRAKKYLKKCKKGDKIFKIWAKIYKILKYFEKGQVIKLLEKDVFAQLGSPQNFFFFIQSN